MTKKESRLLADWNHASACVDHAIASLCRIRDGEDLKEVLEELMGLRDAQNEHFKCIYNKIKENETI